MVSCYSERILSSAIILFLICLFLCSAGCVQDSHVSTKVTPSSVGDNSTALATQTPDQELSVVPTGSAGSDVGITLNSVIRTKNINGARPLEENVYIITDLTIENRGNANFSFETNSIIIGPRRPITEKLYDKLDNPFYWGTIQPNEIRRGEVVFGVREDARNLILNVFNARGTTIYTKELDEGPLTLYSALRTEYLRNLYKNTDFDDVIDKLYSPQLAAEYTNEKFRFYDDNSCHGYTPEQFFKAGKGDCSDFAGFFAYVLEKHGYDAKKVSFKYFNNVKIYRGHVVALFTDKDGQLKYATTPDFRIFRNVSSVEDLIAQEKVRLGIKEIYGTYMIHAPDSSDVCHSSPGTSGQPG